MASFCDALYGVIDIPDWLLPFIRIPEFVRLRGVRLSNVDSVEFKDFGSVTRWEHGIGVAYLATIAAQAGGLGTKETAELVLAALLHDVATPPFAHTAEYVLSDYDHEVETARILSGASSAYGDPDVPIYFSELPRFHEECRKLGKRLGVAIDPAAVAELVAGGGNRGFLIAGTLDLDNADNVVRGCMLLGVPIDTSVPVSLAGWLGQLDSIPLDLNMIARRDVELWRGYRQEYYGRFFEATDLEHGRVAFLQHLMRRALRDGLSTRALLWNTDHGLLRRIASLSSGASVRYRWPSLAELVERYELLEMPTRFLDLPIYDAGDLATLRLPQVVRWLERALSSETLETFLLVNSRRGGASLRDQTLLGRACGQVLGYKLGGGAASAAARLVEG